MGVGPCEGDATAPTAYLKSNLVGLALVKEATYLADSNDLTEIEPSGLGYRDIKKEIDYTDPEDNTKTTSTSILFAWRGVGCCEGEMQEI